MPDRTILLNPACLGAPWWEAAEDDIENAPLAFSHFFARDQEDGSYPEMIVVTQAEHDALRTWAATVPGWDTDGSDQHPLIFG